MHLKFQRRLVVPAPSTRCGSDSPYVLSGGARRLRRFTIGLASALEHSEPGAVRTLRRRERRAPVVPGSSGTLNTYLSRSPAAPSCAPSRTDGRVRKFVLAWVGRRNHRTHRFL